MWWMSKENQQGRNLVTRAGRVGLLMSVMTLLHSCLLFVSCLGSSKSLVLLSTLLAIYYTIYRTKSCNTVWREITIIIDLYQEKFWIPSTSFEMWFMSTKIQRGRDLAARDTPQSLVFLYHIFRPGSSWRGIIISIGLLGKDLRYVQLSNKWHNFSTFISKFLLIVFTDCADIKTSGKIASIIWHSTKKRRLFIALNARQSCVYIQSLDAGLQGQI